VPYDNLETDRLGINPALPEVIMETIKQTIDYLCGVAMLSKARGLGIESEALDLAERLTAENLSIGVSPIFQGLAAMESTTYKIDP
jgi:hypothetical protein